MYCTLGLSSVGRFGTPLSECPLSEDTRVCVSVCACKGVCVCVRVCRGISVSCVFLCLCGQLSVMKDFLDFVDTNSQPNGRQAGSYSAHS